MYASLRSPARRCVSRLFRLVLGPLLAAVAALFAELLVEPTARADVLMQHNDVGRSGATLAETQLTTSSVNVAKFGKVFTRAVNGSVYAQPLYVSALAMPGVGTRNVLFVATMHNGVYAFDADDPAASAPLWQVSLEAAATLPDTNIGGACGTYKDISTEIGIVSTPVIDRAAGVLYTVSFTRTGTASTAQAGYAHWIHALDLTTGAEKPGSPVKVAATAAGTGAGSVGGTIAFQSKVQNQRSGLLLSNGMLYVAFAAFCDTGQYHGWILAYDASSLAQQAVLNTTPDGSKGGIWQAGQGPTVDASGNLYVMTGNGTTNAQTGGTSYGTAFMKLSPQLVTLDYFIPFNFATLNTNDTDLGAAGVLLLPGTNLIAGGGKEGKIYLLDRGGLGGFQTGSDSQVVQSFQASFPSPSNAEGHIHGSPVYWQGPSRTSVYVWPENDFLRAFSFENGLFVSTPYAESTTRAAVGMPGGQLSVSANGNAAGSGIVWSAMPTSADANQAVVAGTLRALDATNVSVQMWSSEINSARDRVGNFAKNSPPTVANGHVYLATFSGYIDVYGLLASTTSLATSGTPSAYGQPVTFTATMTGPATGTPSGTVTFFADGNLLATVLVDGAGKAQWTTATLALGTHAITASYGGDVSFNPSTSAPLAQVVVEIVDAGDGDAGADVEAGADAEADAGAEADAEAEAEAGADAEAEAEADAGADAGADADAEVDANAGGDAGADAEVDASAGADANSGTDASAPADARADATAGGDADADAGASDDGSDGGCSCRAATSPRAAYSPLLLAFALLASRRLRRRKPALDE